MQKGRKLGKTLAWIQIVFSTLLAATVVWGYLSFQTALGEFTKSLGTAIIATAGVISQTAETVQTKQILLDNSLEMLISSRKLIEELRISAQNQSELAPKYADGFRGAAGILTSAGNVFSALGDSLMFSIPTGIQMQGMAPVFVMTRPLAPTAQTIKENARQLELLGGGLQAISSSLSKDSKNVSAAFVDTSNHAIKVLGSAEKALAELNAQELPKAVAELKIASENLRTVSTQVDIAGNVGLVLLIAGLLLAGWCFLNSLSVLYMTDECFSQSRLVR